MSFWKHLFGSKSEVKPSSPLMQPRAAKLVKSFRLSYGYERQVEVGGSVNFSLIVPHQFEDSATCKSWAEVQTFLHRTDVTWAKIYALFEDSTEQNVAYHKRGEHLQYVGGWQPSSEPTLEEIQQAQAERARVEAAAAAEREKRLRAVPMLKMSDGTVLFYPITVVGVLPSSGRTKIMENCDHPERAVMWADELLEKGWSEVRIFAKDRSGKDVFWGHCTAGGEKLFDLADDF